MKHAGTAPRLIIVGGGDVKDAARIMQVLMADKR